MEKPFAITLDVGTSRANKTGSWRLQRRLHGPALPATTPVPPARTSRAGCTRARRAATATSGPGARSWRTTRSRPSWAASATTLRDGLQPRPARRGGRDQLGRGFLGDEAIKQAGRSSLAPAAGSASSWWARAPRACPPPTTSPPRPQSRHQRGRPDGRRHDALRHPQVPPAARRARRRGGGSSTWESSSS